MTLLAESLNSALLHFVWQGVAVGLLLWIVLVRLRDSSAEARYVASCIALGALAVAPILTASLVFTANIGYGRAITEVIDASVLKSPIVASAVKLAVPWGFSGWRAWVLPTWGVGVLLFAIRLAWSWGHTSSLRRKGSAPDSSLLVVVSGLAHRVGVKAPAFRTVTSSVDVPSVVGWLKPVLLLPVAIVTCLTPEQLEALLVHELAHIRRQDYLVNVFQTVVETLLFYHPVVWWVSSRMRYERELCCDDLTVRTLGDAVVYARALAKLEEFRVLRPGLAMGAARGPVLRRIERLIGNKSGEERPSRVACTIALAAGIVCLVMSVSWAQERPKSPYSAAQKISASLASVPAVPPLPALSSATSALLASQPSRISSLLPPPSAPPPSPSTETPAPSSRPPLPPPTATLPERTPGGLGSQDIGQQAPGLLHTATIFVLFRGDATFSDSAVSASDMADARTAHQTAGGRDLLWFRLEGRCCRGSTTEPFVVQDKAVLDRVGQLQGQIEAGSTARAQGETDKVLQAQLELMSTLRALVRSGTVRPAQ